MMLTIIAALLGSMHLVASPSGPIQFTIIRHIAVSNDFTCFQ